MHKREKEKKTKKQKNTQKQTKKPPQNPSFNLHSNIKRVTPIKRIILWWKE